MTNITAEERGMNMMHIPMGEIPPLARKYAAYQCKQFGMCGEVLLTAWTVYAQCVEGLICNDPNYQARHLDIEWFAKERG